VSRMVGFGKLFLSINFLFRRHGSLPMPPIRNAADGAQQQVGHRRVGYLVWSDFYFCSFLRKTPCWRLKKRSKKQSPGMPDSLAPGKCLDSLAPNPKNCWKQWFQKQENQKQLLKTVNFKNNLRVQWPQNFLASPVAPLLLRPRSLPHRGYMNGGGRAEKITFFKCTTWEQLRHIYTEFEPETLFLSNVGVMHVQCSWVQVNTYCYETQTNCVSTKCSHLVEHGSMCFISV